MMDNKQIVIFGFPKWEGDYMKSTVHLARSLAANNEVLYVDYPFTLKDLLKGLKGHKYIPVKEILGINKRLEHLESTEQGSLHLLRLPPILPMNWTNRLDIYKKLASINASLMIPTVKKAMKRLGFENPIVVNAFLPALGIPLKGAFEEELLAYYCYDEISGAPWIKKFGPSQESIFLDEVDLTITSSTQLFQDKGTEDRNIAIVKNGVDMQLFGRQDLLSIPPLSNKDFEVNIGYIGSFDSRVDLDLLGHIVKEMPQCFFSFVGRVLNKEAKTILEQYENVRFYGSQPIERLPSFIEQFDVGIIPFVKNELTAAIYPLKVNEYLARGKAVVSTDFADLSDFRDLIYLGKSKEEFVEAIQTVTSNNKRDLFEKRIQMAKQNSWQNRAQTFEEILNRRLITKKRKEITENRISA